MGYTTLVEAAKVAEAVNADAKISVSVDQSDAGSKAPTPSHGFPRYSRCCTTRDGWMNSGVAIESGRDIVPTESRQSDLAKAVIRRTDMDLLFGSCAVAYGHLVCTEALASTGK